MIHYSQTKGARNADFTQLLMEARNILQPQYTNETLCTVLIGSPGPQDMEFVSVSCNRKLKVSGIMCIKGGINLMKHEPLYRLTQLKLKAKDGQLVTNTEESYFNIDILYEALSKGKSPPESQGESVLLEYFETLDDWVYSQVLRNWSQHTPHAWTEYIYSCSNSSHSIDLCNLLWPYNESSTHNIQNLTFDLFITSLKLNIQKTSLSVWISNYSMFASNYCRQGALFDGKQCIHLLQKPPGRNSTLDNLCHNSSSESSAYVYSGSGDPRTISSILHRLDIVGEQATCHDELGNTVVLLLKSDKLEARLSEQVDPAATYVVCSSQPAQPTCPPSYVICNSGYISEQFLCDGKIDCDNGEDEQNCTHLCSSFNKSPNYCQTKCHPDNCTCHELFFPVLIWRLHS